MASHQFLVTVDVEDWPEEGAPPGFGERTEAEYARLALWSAGLRDSSVLDGFADVDGAVANITGVEMVG
jgi:hypothetical protein